VTGFLQRLKERKLVQWAIACVAAGFALLQGIDIIAQRFGWPESSEAPGTCTPATSVARRCCSSARPKLALPTSALA
jgi:hypothetical protein